MSEHLKAHKEGTLYFCTLTVVGWADVFTRKRNAEVIIESLAYCQKASSSRRVGEKGLELFAYVLMPSHLHLIGRVQEGRLSDVLPSAFTLIGLRPSRSHFFSASTLINALTSSLRSGGSCWSLETMAEVSGSVAEGARPAM